MRITVKAEQRPCGQWDVVVPELKMRVNGSEQSLTATGNTEVEAKRALAIAVSNLGKNDGIIRETDGIRPMSIRKDRAMALLGQAGIKLSI